MDLNSHWVGLSAIAIFVLAYGLLIAEEYVHVRKFIPVILAAGLIRVLVAFKYSSTGSPHAVIDPHNTETIETVSSTLINSVLQISHWMV